MIILKQYTQFKVGTLRPKATINPLWPIMDLGNAPKAYTLITRPQRTSN